MKLILTRHGETIENSLGICQGHMPGTLSEKGLRQAEKLGERFKEEKIDAIYSSDLARAADTAKEIAKHHPNVPFILTEELRERQHGDWTGKTREDQSPELPKNAEQTPELLARAKKFIDEIYEKHFNKTIIALGHGAINCAIIASITGKTFEETLKMEKWSNTNVNIFEFDEDKNHKIHCLNCTKHLD